MKPEKLGNICKAILAGEVLAVSSASYKWRRTTWTIVVSGDPGSYSLIVVDDAGVRVAERLQVGDFVVAEATLIPKGARCEIRALLIQSNRESRLPVIPARTGEVADHVGADMEDPDTEGLPWEDAIAR
jgi:UDP-N-acetyl-D-mannosaminuronate dehydrogenase